MLESYSIGIRVFLRNQIGSGLKTMSAQLTAAQKNVNALERDMKRLERAGSANGPLARQAALQQNIIQRSQRSTQRLHAQDAALAQQVTRNQQKGQAQVERLFLQRENIRRRMVEAEKKGAREVAGASATVLAAQDKLTRIERQRHLANEGFAKKEKVAASSLSQIQSSAAITQARVALQDSRTKRALRKVDEQIADKEKEYHKARVSHSASKEIKNELADLKEKRALIEDSGIVAQAVHAKTLNQAAHRKQLVQEELTRLPAARSVATANFAQKAAKAATELEAAKEVGAATVASTAAKMKGLERGYGVAGTNAAAAAAATLQRENSYLEARKRIAQDIAAAEEKGARAVKTHAELEERRRKAASDAGGVKERLEKEQQLLAKHEKTRRRKRLGAAAGIGVAGVGIGTIASLAGTLDEASEFEHKKIQADIAHPGFSKAIMPAIMRTQRKFPQISLVDILEGATELQKITNDMAETAKLLPDWTGLAGALSVSSRGWTDKDQPKLAGRALEQMGFGPTKNQKTGVWDDKTFRKHLRYMGRVFGYYGGDVGGAVYQGLAKYGGDIAFTDEFMYGHLPWLLSSAATARGGAGAHGGIGPKINAYTQWVSGTASYNPRTTELLEKLKLFPESSIEHGKKRDTIVGPMLGIEAYENPFLFTKQLMGRMMKAVPGLREEDFQSQNRRKKMLTFGGQKMSLSTFLDKVFAHQKLAKYMFLQMAGNVGPVEKEAKAGMLAMWPDAAVRFALRRDPKTQKEAIGKQWEGVKTVIGGSFMGQYSHYLRKLIREFKVLLQVMSENPQVVKLWTHRAVKIGAVMSVLGSAFALWNVGKLFGFSQIISLIGKFIWAIPTKGLPLLGRGIMKIALALAGFSSLELAVIAVGLIAVGAAIYYLYQLDWTSIAAKIKGAWSDLAASFVPGTPQAASLAGGYGGPDPAKVGFSYGNDVNVQGKPKQWSMTNHNHFYVDGKELQSHVEKKTFKSLDRQTSQSNRPDYKEIRTTANGRSEQ